MGELPPGFVLDDAPASAAAPTAGALPPGFTLDDDPAPQAAAEQGGWASLHWPTMPSLASVYRGTVNGAREAGNALASVTPASVYHGVVNGAQGTVDTLTTPHPDGPSLVGMVKDAGRAGQGALTLTREALDGTLDPTSDDAVKRATEFAMLASPLSAGSAAARGGVEAARAIAPHVAEAEALRVPLSAGQRTVDPALLSREDAMMGGAMGEGAQRVAQDFRDAQRQAITDAAGRIEGAAGRDQVALERNQDAGQLAMDAVQNRANAARADYRARYDNAFAQDGTLDPAVFTGRGAPAPHPDPARALPGAGASADAYAAPISQRITDALVSAPDPYIIDPVLTPAAHRALGTLDNIDNLRLGSIGQPGAGDAVTGVNLRGVDQARRQLAAHARAAASNPADQRAMRGVIDQFDNQIQTAMENGMFSGSDDALNALRDARQAYASYRRTFTQQGGRDDVGRVMDEIINRDATPEQVANRLYGGTQVGQNPTSVRVADRLRDVLGEGSPEWSAIRQGAWQRVLGPLDQSPQRAATRIDGFLNGDGRSLAERLFTPDERQHMQSLANVIRATASRAGTANASQSGNRLAALMRKSLTAIGASLGATSSHSLVGSGLGALAGRSAEGLGGVYQTRQARQLFAGQVPVTIGGRLRQAGRPVVTTGQRRLAPIARQYIRSQEVADQ